MTATEYAIETTTAAGTDAVDFIGTWEEACKAFRADCSEPGIESARLIGYDAERDAEFVLATYRGGRFVFEISERG